MPTFAATNSAKESMRALLADYLPQIDAITPQQVNDNAMFLHSRSNGMSRLMLVLTDQYDLLLSTAPPNNRDIHYIIERVIPRTENDYRKLSGADIQMMQTIAPLLSSEGFGNLNIYQPGGNWEAIGEIG